MQTPVERARSIRRTNKRNAEPTIYNKVRAIIAGSLSGKYVMQGDTMADLVRRHCGQAFEVASQNGLVLDVDLPENLRVAPFEKFEVLFVLKPLIADWQPVPGSRPN